MERTYIKDLSAKVGQEVRVCGWISIRRDHGKLVFFDVRDMSGSVQAVVLPQHAEVHALAQKVRSEWVVDVTAKVNARPPKMVNEKEANGAIELELTAMTILNEAEAPAIDAQSEGTEIGEDVRLKYRYIDLKRPRMQRNIRMRHKVVNLIRNHLDTKDFIEIETPILTKSTPEGARDYIVPSRLEPGKFYALPQSPQQYKQLLMVSGFERYFQIARCFRDEDTRADRQPEFTQLDIEMSFVDREAVMQLNEELLIRIVRELFPEKRIQQVPFPRMTYTEAMEKYGTDRPDVRENKEDLNLLAFCWVIDFPFFEKVDKDNPNSGWTFTHNPFSAPKPEHMDALLNATDIEQILTTQYDVALNGFEIGGGSIRNHKPEALKAAFGIMGYASDTIEANFGHMLKALSAGAPPHGGIAWGLDRLMAILLNEASIREVITFAKTGEGKDLMMQAPSEVTDAQLKELHISVPKKK